MKPLDPRLLPHLTPARLPLAGVVAASTASGLLLVLQAFAVARLITALFAGPSDGSWDAAVDAGVLLGLVTVGRAGTSWLVDVLSARASAQVTATLRHRLLTAALSLGPYGLSRRRSGEVALLATRGVAAIDPYLTRYLPALVVAAVLPALTVLAIATQDLLSAGIVVATLPLVPVFAVLVGLSIGAGELLVWPRITAANAGEGGQGAREQPRRDRRRGHAQHEARHGAEQLRAAQDAVVARCIKAHEPDVARDHACAALIFERDLRDLGARKVDDLPCQASAERRATSHDSPERGQPVTSNVPRGSGVCTKQAAVS